MPDYFKGVVFYTIQAFLFFRTRLILSRELAIFLQIEVNTPTLPNLKHRDKKFLDETLFSNANIDSFSFDYNCSQTY